MYVRIRSVNIKDSYREGMESYLYLAPSSAFYSFFDLYTSRTCVCVTTCVHTSMCMHSHVHIWSFPRYLGTFIQLSSLEVLREALSVVSPKCSTDFSPMELYIWERWECLFSSPSYSSSWYRILLHCLGTLAILKSLPSTSMFFTVSAHLVSGDLFILFVHTWWLQCTSYKWMAYSF